MKLVRILVVEDLVEWLDRLCFFVKTAVPNSDLKTAATFPLALQALTGEHWDLLVTDVGLPPDDGYVLGKLLVGRAKELRVPCVVVSGTDKVTKADVRDILIDYDARNFFTKDELLTTHKQLEFQNMVRECTNSTILIAVAEGLESPSMREREITIGIRSERLYLSSAGLGDFLIPEGPMTNAFLFFARNVCDAVPTKIVKHEVLNEVVGEVRDQKASQPLRNAINKLNQMFTKWVGLETKTRWIIRGMGESGYCLNSKDIEWKIDKELRKHLIGGRTLYDVLVDPHKMATNTPDREHRLPARARRPQIDTENDSN